MILAKILRRLCCILIDVMKYAPFPAAMTMRNLCYRPVLKKMGPGCNISDGVTIKHPTGLSLGMRVSIHEYTYISASGGVVIGDHVAIGSGCSLISNAHNFDKKNVLIKKQGISQRPIYIGNDVLLGVKVTVLPGVTIGNGAIVGAGSVVTKNIPPYTVNAGVPSRVLRDR